MTPIQNIWLTIFNFGPAIYLGIYKQWWVGVLALVATFALSWVLVLFVSSKMPINILSIWAWLKPPIVGAIIVSAGIWLI